MKSTVIVIAWLAVIGLVGLGGVLDAGAQELASPLAGSAGAAIVAALAANAQPAAPLAPEVVTRSDDGTKATLRAIRLPSAIKIDGRLDEEIYETAQSIGGFVQQEPRQ